VRVRFFCRVVTTRRSGKVAARPQMGQGASAGPRPSGIAESPRGCKGLGSPGGRCVKNGLNKQKNLAHAYRLAGRQRRRGRPSDSRENAFSRRTDTRRGAAPTPAKTLGGHHHTAKRSDRRLVLAEIRDRIVFCCTSLQCRCSKRRCAASSRVRTEALRAFSWTSREFPSRATRGNRGSTSSRSAPK